MPTVKPRSPRRHPPSLPRFALAELAPFTKEGTFSTDASRDFHLCHWDQAAMGAPAAHFEGRGGARGAAQA
jgi:hypothetical protein